MHLERGDPGAGKGLGDGRANDSQTQDKIRPGWVNRETLDEVIKGAQGQVWFLTVILIFYQIKSWPCTSYVE